MSLVIHAGAVSAQGRRDQNEDAVLSSPELGLFVVADGTGGRAGGKTAANLAIDAIGRELKRALPSARDKRAALGHALATAHQTIREAQQKNVAEHAMSTTAVVLLLDGPELHVAHVGDSRAYLWRHGRLEVLTRDHSYANYLADHPEVRPKGDRPGTMLMRALGAGAEIPAPDHKTVSLEEGDVVLACTDGITGPLPAWVLGAQLGGVGLLSEDASAAALVRTALAHGSQDNISAVILRADIDGDLAGALGWLAFIEGSEQGRVISLGPSTTVGVDQDCEVVLTDAFVSGRHAQIRATPEGFLLKDLASRNGTFINEQRVREEPLADSDILRFGQTSLIFKSLKAEV